MQYRGIVRQEADSPQKPEQQKTPETPEDFIQAAGQDFKDGNHDEAKDKYIIALSLFPDHPEALFGLAVLHHSLEKYSEAIAFYRRLLSFFPDHLETLQNLANAFVQCGNRYEAKKIYTTLLDRDPENLTAQYNLGTLYYHEDNLAVAIDCFQKVLIIKPNHFEAHYNLGVIWLHQDNLEEAEKHFQAGLDINPEDVDALFNLGLVFKKMGRQAKALSCFNNALQLAPYDAESHFQAGLTLKNVYDFNKAMDFFLKAIELNPAHGPAHSFLGVTYQLLGKIPQAISAFEQAIHLQHAPIAARHMINALSGHTTDSAPRQYIADLFDHYADHFDASLVDDLEYHVPGILYDCVRAAFPDGPTFRQAIDLGCGTGLAGKSFQNITTHLHGVDLSVNMVNNARRKNIYETLATDDIVDFLNRSEIHYDLFIATDVLVYLGDLGPLFKAIQAKASPEACFAFSTEICNEAPYKLRPSGRYAYSSSYILKLAAEHGCNLLFKKRANIRREKGTWIEGEVFGLLFSK